MSTPPIPPAKPAPSRPTVVPKAQALTCPSCGASMAVRTFANAVNVACPSCGSILDATNPKLEILQKFARKQRITPLIPLGSRGKWQGTLYEVVGVQRRSITSDDMEYVWFEYVLFNPYAGYRYLTEYDGHWNDVVVCEALPKVTDRNPSWTLGNDPNRQIRFTSASARPTAILDDRVYKHFQSASATTADVLGEFPWQVRVDDKVTAKDYISPPYMLSSEENDQETTWSLGTYVSGKDVWQAFKLQGSPPQPQGVYANQPNPFGDSPGRYWQMAVMLLGLALALVIIIFMASANKEVFTASYTYYPIAKQEASFVTPVFELPGRTSNVEIETNTDLNDSWVYLNYALINEDSGQAYDFGREVSYYSGYDSDGHWSEGGRNDTAVIPAVPAGHYYLRVEPEKDVGSQPVAYTVRVKRDVPSFSFFLIAALLLVIPPAVMSARAWSFEYKRLQESDYAPSGS
jgi:hypothetical protein